MFSGAPPLGGPPPALAAVDESWRGRTRAEDEAARRERGRMMDVCMIGDWRVKRSGSKGIDWND